MINSYKRLLDLISNNDRTDEEGVGDEMRREEAAKADIEAKREAALAFVARTRRRQAEKEAAELAGNTLRDKGRARAKEEAGKVK